MIEEMEKAEKEIRGVGVGARETAEVQGYMTVSFSLFFSFFLSLHHDRIIPSFFFDSRRGNKRPPREMK